MKTATHSRSRLPTSPPVLPAASFASSPQVRQRMQQQRRAGTAPELAVRRAAHRLGLRYFVNRRPLPSLRRSADSCFPARRSPCSSTVASGMGARFMGAADRGRTPGTGRRRSPATCAVIWIRMISSPPTVGFRCGCGSTTTPERPLVSSGASFSSGDEVLEGGFDDDPHVPVHDQCRG